MAQNQQSVQLNDGVWTQITNADVTALTFQVLVGEAFIRYTTDTTIPTEQNGVRYGEGDAAFMANLTSLTALALAVRVWAKPASSKDCLVYVDHA